MNTYALQCVFWASAFLLFFTYLGYPLLMALLARGTNLSPPLDPVEWPTVTVVLIAHNEANRLPARIQNLLASDYPADRLSVVVVSDGSTDGTAEFLAKTPSPRVSVVVQAVQQGKAAGLNIGVAAAPGDIVVFADARQSFAPQTIQELSRALLDPRVGAVSGELEVAPSADGLANGLDAYWRLERFLRAKEAAVASCIGCTGAAYAIRRALYTPLPADTLLDDVVIPMQIVLQGYRIGFCSAAKAFDPQKLAPDKETRRKRRTLTGNFQMLFRYPSWLLPWRNPLCGQLIAHKYLRLLAPLLLITLVVVNALLTTLPLYKAVSVLHAAFYAAALVGRFLPHRLFALPAAFVFLNLNVVCAFYDYTKARNLGPWKRVM